MFYVHILHRLYAHIIYHTHAYIIHVHVIKRATLGCPTCDDIHAHTIHTQHTKYIPQP